LAILSFLSRIDVSWLFFLSYQGLTLVGYSFFPIKD
jgi:hypothetical protein